MRTITQMGWSLAAAMMFALALSALKVSTARAEDLKCYYFNKYIAPEGGVVCANAGKACKGCIIKV